MSVVARNNIRIIDQGSSSDRRPIVFMHGFGCDQNVWRHVTPAFADDYRLVLFDLVGAGRSDLSQYDQDKYASLEGYATDLIEIVRELELQDAIVVGHSVSSMIAMLAAVREPELFSRLVMVGPSPCYMNDSDYSGGFDRKDIEDLLAAMDSNFFGWSGMVAPLIMGNPDRPELSAELNENFCRTDPSIARQFARVTFLSDSRSELHRLTVPSLILQCSSDALAPPAVGNYLQQAMPGSTLAMLKATGHCPHLSGPDEMNEIIRDWLKA